MRATLEYRCLVIASLIMSLVFFAMPTLAQQDEIAAGRAAGKAGAKAHINRDLWRLIGLGGCCFGIIAAYMYEPNPPVMELLGRSPEYVAAYTDAYREAAKGVQSRAALTGCALGIIFSVVTNIMLLREE